MNSTIKILPETVVNKIAAGEVIERPSSVIKELIENSIDANAKNIEVRIKNGGKDLIQVIDDGIGMSEKDAQLSFERHATSKINSFEDLQKIKTFGFRGEALSSIASVSIMELKTKAQTEKEGIFIRIAGGNQEEMKKIPWNAGTSNTVNTLFFNVPGRRKFLKSNLSESRQIYATFKKTSLANTPISFQLFNDDKIVWKLKKDTLENRLTQLFNEELVENAIRIHKEIYGLHATGFIAKPDYARKIRGEQFLFVNKRPIKNRMVHHALITGYGETIAKGDIPFYCIFIDIDPNIIDINVHPTKSEIKFKNESQVYSFIVNSVRESLSSKEKILHMPQQDSQNRHYVPEQRSFDRQKGQKSEEINQTELELQADITEKKIERENIWQIHNKYIISQIKSGLVIIDQHAAHERILFEKFLKYLRTGAQTSQKLLFPVSLKLTKEDFIILHELMGMLNKIGFNIRILENESGVIDAIPTYIRRGKEETIVQEMISEYKREEFSNFDKEHKLAASFACRGSIMSGDQLSLNEMNQLIDELFATEFPFFCPHGRPTVIDLTLRELDKKFQR